MQTIEEEIKEHVINYIREYTSYDLINEKNINITKIVTFLHVEDKHWREYLGKPNYIGYAKSLVDYFLNDNNWRFTPKSNSVLVRTRKDYNGTYVDFLSY